MTAKPYIPGATGTGGGTGTSVPDTYLPRNGNTSQGIAIKLTRSGGDESWRFRREQRITVGTEASITFDGTGSANRLRLTPPGYPDTEYATANGIAVAIARVQHEILGVQAHTTLDGATAGASLTLRVPTAALPHEDYATGDALTIRIQRGQHHVPAVPDTPGTPATPAQATLMNGKLVFASGVGAEDNGRLVRTARNASTSDVSWAPGTGTHGQYTLSIQTGATYNQVLADLRASPFTTSQELTFALAGGTSGSDTVDGTDIDASQTAVALSGGVNAVAGTPGTPEVPQQILTFAEANRGDFILRAASDHTLDEIRTFLLAQSIRVDFDEPWAQFTASDVVLTGSGSSVLATTEYPTQINPAITIAHDFGGGVDQVDQADMDWTINSDRSFTFSVASDHTLAEIQNFLISKRWQLADGSQPVIQASDVTLTGSGAVALAASELPSAVGGISIHTFAGGINREPLAFDTFVSSKVVRLLYDDADNFGEISAASTSNGDIDTVILGGTPSNATPVAPPSSGHTDIPFGVDAIPGSTTTSASTTTVTESGGLERVTSDSTLSGTGEVGSPLRVANPFTAADETKLDSLVGVTANPGSPTGTLSSISIDGTSYSVSTSTDGGTTVVANPGGSPTTQLSTIRIGSVDYTIVGTGSASTEARRLWFSSDAGALDLATHQASEIPPNVINGNPSIADIQVGDSIYNTTDKRLWEITAKAATTFTVTQREDFDEHIRSLAGTTVTANPDGSDGDLLNRIQIAGTNYRVPTAEDPGPSVWLTDNNQLASQATFTNLSAIGALEPAGPNDKSRRHDLVIHKSTGRVYRLTAVSIDGGVISGSYVFTLPQPDLSSYLTAVTTANIENSAVTSDKIAADAVTNAKIGDNAVDTENIAADAVTSAELEDTVLEANPSGTDGNDLSRVKLRGTNYNLPSGTTVEANPTGSGGTALNSLSIAGTRYTLPQPSDGGLSAVETAAPLTGDGTSGNAVTFDDSLTATQRQSARESLGATVAESTETLTNTSWTAITVSNTQDSNSSTHTVPAPTSSNAEKFQAVLEAEVTAFSGFSPSARFRIAGGPWQVLDTTSDNKVHINHDATASFNIEVEFSTRSTGSTVTARYRLTGQKWIEKGDLHDDVEHIALAAATEAIGTQESTLATAVTSHSSNQTLSITATNNGEIVEYTGSNAGIFTFPIPATVGHRKIVRNSSSANLSLRAGVGALGNVGQNSSAVVLGTSTGWDIIPLGADRPFTASESTAGIAEIASTSETNTGTDNSRIITPAKLRAQVGTAVSSAEISAGTSTSIRRFTPANIHAMIDAHAPAGVGGSSSIITGYTGHSGNAVLTATSANNGNAELYLGSSATAAFTLPAVVNNHTRIISHVGSGGLLTVYTSNGEVFDRLYPGTSILILGHGVWVGVTLSDKAAPVTTTERTAGTETDIRRFSPADIASMIGTHGDSGSSIQYAEFWGFGQNERFPNTFQNRNTTGTSRYHRSRFARATPNVQVNGDMGVRALLASEISTADLLAGETSLLDFQIIRLPVGLYAMTFSEWNSINLNNTSGAYIYQILAGTDDRLYFAGTGRADNFSPPLNAGNLSNTSAQSMEVNLTINCAVQTDITIITGLFDNSTETDGLSSLSILKLS